MDKFFKLSEEVVTPHISWAKPYKKRVKVLFITLKTKGREIIELSQRMDLDYEFFPFLSSSSISPSDIYGFDREFISNIEVELKKRLNGEYDFIIIGGIDWNAIPIGCRYLILKKVKEGCILIGNWQKEDEYIKRAREKEIKIDNYFLFPYKGLPAFSRYNDFKEFTDSTIKISEFGKGKIIFLNYSIPGHCQILTPGPSGDLFYMKEIEYDYYLAFIIHLLLKSSNYAPEIELKGNDYIKINRENLSNIEVNLNSSKDGIYQINYTLRNRDNEIIFENKRQEKINTGENKLNFKIEKSIPKGEYFFDIIVRNNKGEVENFGSIYLDVGSEYFIKEVNIEDNYKKTDDIKGKISLNKKGEGLYLKIIQKDNFDRITNKKIVPVESENVEFVLNQKGIPLSIVQYIEAELIKRNETIDKFKKVFTISDLYPKDDIRYIIWGDITPSYLTKKLYMHHYRNGFDTHYTGFSPLILLSNLYHIPYATRYVDFKTDWYPHPGIEGRTKEDHVRYPCLTDPEYLKEVEKTLTDKANQLKKFSVIEYSMGDECHFVAGKYELCFSPTCVANFHKFLKEEYGTIENLNKEYESNYKSFEDVKPVTLEDVKKDPKLIPLWVDYRRHMESTWAGIYKFSKDVIQKVVPDAKIGYEGSDSADVINSYRACDFYKLMNVMELNNTYERGFTNKAVRDFAKEDSLIGLGWYGGYYPSYCVTNIYNKYVSWNYLFNGANSFWVWWSLPGAGGSVTASDFSFYDYFKENIRQVKEIKNGIGRLIINSERDDDGIALLYSTSSIHKSTLTEELPQMEDVLNSYASLFKDINFGYRVISYKQIEDGILRKGKFKLLILPYCQSISEKEAEEIRLFVKNGGILLADIRPGISDQHGKNYKKGILDDIFGVNHETEKLEIIKKEIPLNIEGFSEKVPETFINKSIKITDGEAKIILDGVPLFIENQYGKGKGLLLNFSIWGYVKLEGEVGVVQAEKEKKAEILSRLFKSILIDYCGIEEKVKINPEIGVNVYKFSKGNNKYIGLLQSIPEPYENYLKGIAKPITSQKINIKLDKTYYVYDVREGKYLGYKTEFNTDIQPAEAKLFSLLPYRVEGLKINIPKKIKQGEKINYKIEVKAEKGEPGTHIIHLDLIDPEGRKVDYYSENLVANRGKIENSMIFALNEKIGIWKIRVKDVATGKTVEEEFEILKDGGEN